MSEPAPRIAKLPFIIGDLLLLAAAAYIALYGASLGKWQYAAMVGAVAFGAWLAVWPFVLEFRALTKLLESSALTSATEKIKDLDKVAGSISSAVTEWQHLQQSATQTVTAAEHIAERMTTEARNFGEILGRMNEAEKSHLRLEVEKLRRAEGDWLGITVRILDHVHALHQAGVRSGQRNIVDQLSNFQQACRETARRMGIVPVMPETEVPFDPRAHRLLDDSTPDEGAIITDIIAPGYTFQGQMIRLPVVAVKETESTQAKAENPELPLEQSTS
jgi:molecular chaperone GrpE (heat shock protein)